LRLELKEFAHRTPWIDHLDWLIHQCDPESAGRHPVPQLKIIGMVVHHCFEAMNRSRVGFGCLAGAHSGVFCAQALFD